MQTITSDNTEHSALGRQNLDLGSRREEPVLTVRQHILVVFGLIPAIIVAILANQALFFSVREQQYADVPPSSAFYVPAARLTSLGMVTGYPCGQSPQEPCDEKKRPYFRVGESVTRAQLARLIVMADDARDPKGQSQSADLPAGTQTYADVPPTHLYYRWVEETGRRAFMQGYPCGGAPTKEAREPCDSHKRPYFRPDSAVSRAELALSIFQADPKIRDDPKVILQATFEDVPKDHPFWLYIEQVYGRGIMTGYACSGCSASLPCVPPDNRSYFRPDAPVTNGQVARTIANALIVP